MQHNQSNIENLQGNFASDIYQTKGESEVEIANYDAAILSLSKAIKLNPENKSAFFERAIAYFEIGKFDEALEDYLACSVVLTPQKLFDFSLGITTGGFRGFQDASIEFFPLLCHSLRGIGSLLWMNIAHPISAPNEFAESITNFCELLQTCDKAELAKTLVPEMYELIVNWNNLSHKKRGELAGYSLSKYGTDLFLSIATLKGARYVQACRSIKKAEKLCLLETLAKSPEHKKALIQASNQWNKHRSDWFSKVQIEADKQSKHLLNSNKYLKGRSILSHANPEELLQKHAGRGYKIKGIPGESGFKERVDFGEVIGYFIEVETGKQTPTSIGIIHYSKKGAHIVPAKPK